MWNGLDSGVFGISGVSNLMRARGLIGLSEITDRVEERAEARLLIVDLYHCSTVQYSILLRYRIGTDKIGVKVQGFEGLSRRMSSRRIHEYVVYYVLQ